MSDIAYKEDVLLFLDAEIEEEKRCESKHHDSGEEGHCAGVLWYIEYFGNCECVRRDVLHIRCDGFVQHCLELMRQGPVQCAACDKFLTLMVIERAN